MNTALQVAAAKEFAEKWKGKGDEKQHTQTFWIELLQKVYGVEDPFSFITFEDKVKLEHTSFIDANIAETKVMIEQKSIGKDLSKPIKQSDGTFLTPYRQAKRYADELPYSQRPRWIVASNFSEFHVYDMENPHGEPEVIELKNLPKEYYRLNFLVNTKSYDAKKEMELSLAAGEIVGRLYDALLKQYKDPTNEESLKSLNKLCVRLVFCLYAEDAGIFGARNMFHDYLREFREENVRMALIELFKVLDTPLEERDQYMKESLAAFPYVNGGLFSDEKIEIPNFTDEILELLLKHASRDFDWSGISPTIFGAVFESTLNPETRRSGGMHYTSIENIHKVIDPLFLDELKNEFEIIKCGNTRTKKDQEKRKIQLYAFQKKLSSLTFLDPACGSGNFLTETYISLRRLENDFLREIYGIGMALDFAGEYNPIQVSIGQFYGIEINDFAVTVAKTALWIAESQMMQETIDIVHKDLDFLPLKSYANIVEGNALRLDWNEVVPKEKLNYIMGNPPFVGTKLMSSSQKDDTKTVLKEFNNYGTLDYVSCWYAKANTYITDTNVECAFVSTNSICQGEQVTPLWEKLFNDGVIINFAHRTFRWDSEANAKAQVHCIIVGFSKRARKEKVIFDGALCRTASNINAYLVDADNVFIKTQKKPLCNVQEMFLGCDFKDDGHYILQENEKVELEKNEPVSRQYIKKYINAKELTNRIHRYCLWLQNAEPKELKMCPTICKRVEAVRSFRAKSDSPDTQRYANYPTRPARLRYYSVERKTAALCLPRTSSASRRYLPMELIDKDTIGGASILMIPEATLYTFSILNSNVHMSWMRTVCGRMKSDYRYANGLVYNTFPWPSPTENQKIKMEQTAQAILDARAKYPNSSLADLYDEVLMPPELRKAHQANDRAVMEAYGFWGKLNSESACVAELMKMYQQLVEK